MKVIRKIIIVLVTIVCLMAIFKINIPTVEATVKTEIEDIGNNVPTVSAGGFTTIVKKLLGLIRLLTGLLSIIVIAYTGFEMVTETPEGKKKVKEKMIPIVTGVLLVFLATNIATFIVGIFE